MARLDDYRNLDIDEIALALIRDLKIQIRSTWVDRNPSMIDDTWSRSASHYKVKISRRTPIGQRREMTLVFSLGSAHKGEPQLKDVLNCLVSDAGVDQLSFEEFCSEYGYNEDSRAAERVYRATTRQTTRFLAFLED